jgi:hypothetical protein
MKMICLIGVVGVFEELEVAEELIAVENRKRHNRLSAIINF